MLEIRQLDVSHHSPLEPADETRLESRDFRWRAVAREHDLPSGFVQRVERVKELLLCRFLSLQELNVVDEEQIGFAKSPTELMRRAILNGAYQLVRKLFCANKRDARVWLAREQLMCNCLHEMGLADARIAVDEERVVNTGRRLRDSMRGGSGELVRLPNDKVSEGVALTERWRIAATILSGAGLALRRWRCNEKIHLRPRLSLLVDSKDHGERMSECDRRQAREQIGVLGLVPVRGELIGRADVDCPPIDRQRLGRLEPRSKGLVW